MAVLAVPDRERIEPSEAVSLTSRTDASGRLRWTVPSGSWRILRFAYTPSRANNVWGLHTDGMSAEAMDKTWESPWVRCCGR